MSLALYDDQGSWRCYRRRHIPVLSLTTGAMIHVCDRVNHRLQDRIPRFASRLQNNWPQLYATRIGWRSLLERRTCDSCATR